MTTFPNLPHRLDPADVLLGTVADITDEELLSRAVANARSRAPLRYSTRQVAVMDTFVLGSTYAGQLCRRFGFNPDEEVKR